MSDPIIPKVKVIPGAKLVKGVWQDEDGNPLTNAQLIKLRTAAERAQKAEDRAAAKAEKAKS
jgi:hypothetical protein